jgi:hypothetical protein
MHSWLRQAVSLTVRLGCPLQQVIYLHLVKDMDRGQEQSCLKYAGLEDANQAQTRLTWLGHTVGASFPFAVSILHAWIIPQLFLTERTSLTTASTQAALQLNGCS